MDDVAEPLASMLPREAYEAPRLDEIGAVNELTQATGASVQDDPG